MQQTESSILISVRKLCGPVCVSKDNGGQICFNMHSVLQSDQDATLTLDFSGVEVLTPAFLNAAIACLYEGTFTPEYLADHVHFSGLSADHQALLDLIIQNAKRFYAASQQGRENIVEATARSLATCQ